MNTDQLPPLIRKSNLQNVSSHFVVACKIPETIQNKTEVINRDSLSGA